jgi:hypothetical protein
LLLQTLQYPARIVHRAMALFTCTFYLSTVLSTRHCSSPRVVLFMWDCSFSPLALFIRRRFSAPCGHHAGRHRGSCPPSRRPRTLRRRPPLCVTTSKPPASTSRSPRPPPWSRRLQLSVSVCHLRFHRRLPRPQPRSSSPPPL